MKIMENFYIKNNTIFPSAFFSTHKIFFRKLSRKLFNYIPIKTQNASKIGTALVSYVTHPFTISLEELDRAPHTNPLECMIIVDLLLKKGFDVDVIDWTNKDFIPKKRYEIIIDVNNNLKRFSVGLNKKSTKIFYITGAHWKYQNDAENKRLNDFYKRNGVYMEARRQLNPSENIENTDYATSLGNNFAKDTYLFKKNEIVSVPLFSRVTFESPKDKEFKNIAKNFIWIGGGGAIHKGLDLVIEAFRELPDFNLTILGPVNSEKDFEKYYKKDLYESENITFYGRIDLKTQKFKDIVKKSIGLIYPSCSEGQAGSVISGIHAGLIPIASYESGVDVGPFGIVLETQTIEEIKQSLINISKESEESLQHRAVAAWEYANKFHTVEKFTKKYDDFLNSVIVKEKYNE